jgi:AcrR family transcriptional regulator
MPSRGRLNRDTVVRAAADLMDRNPGQELSLTELARHLNIKTPSLYNHIDSLDELRQDVAVFGVCELTTQLGSAAIGRSGKAALVALAWAYRDFATQRPGLYQSIQRAPGNDQVELARAAERALDIFRRVLDPMGLSETEQIHAIRSLRAMVHGFVSLEQAGGFGMPVDLDESFQYLVEMFLAQVVREREAGVR